MIFRLFNPSVDTPSVVLAVAHPDDEIIGAGAQLSRWKPRAIIFVTDGAPRNGLDAAAHGFSDPRDYARARRREAEAALGKARLSAIQLYWLSFPDQEASFDLPGVTAKLADLLAELGPEMIVTHPYEGGHPDHDATCFAVHMACRGAGPAIVEMTSYHNEKGQFRAGSFLNEHPENLIRIPLSTDDQKRKRDLFDCYVTQQKVLEGFPLDHESFRLAPDYDFTSPPHSGTLYYELFDWGMRGDRWRALAREAIRGRAGKRVLLESHAYS